MEVQFIIAIFFVILIIVLQIWSFNNTRKEINTLSRYFPLKQNITIQNNSVRKDIIDDDNLLTDFLSNDLPGVVDDATIISMGEAPADYIIVPLVVCSNKSNREFVSTTRELNAYLCRNNDVAGADFAIIKDIYESRLKSMQSNIQNNLNTPLLLGLAGTFIGIIIGLWGIDIKEFLVNGNLDSIDGLLLGVSCAMVASLIGLTLTIVNNSISYKKAYDICETEKDSYFNILRRQLLPSLSSTMEQGLSSLKGVLGQFVSSFGNQLQGYTNAFQLLNDNIKQEHELIEEINKLNITKTSLSIARSFGKLKEVSDKLDVFHSYQQSLNNTIDNVNMVLSQFESLTHQYSDFFNALNMVVTNQNIASQMQRQFTEVIEQHFPLGSEARERWQKEHDLLVSDAQKTSQLLQQELQTTTNYIANFVAENKNSINSLNELPSMLVSLGRYAELQTTCYNDLKDTILKLISHQQKNQIEIVELHKSILEALRVTTKAIKEK